MVRLADWPRMPYLNDEVREWAAQQLVTLGVDEIAVYAHEAGAESEQRRLLVATEIAGVEDVAVDLPTGAVTITSAMAIAVTFQGFQLFIALLVARSCAGCLF